MNILMFAHGGSLNRGCEAIVRSTATIIKNKIDNSRVYLASGKPETDKFIEKIDGVFDGSTRTIKKYSKDWIISMLNVKLFKDDTYAISRYEENTIKHMKNMDVLLSVGGDNYCYGDQPALYVIDKKAKEQGKKLVLWGCSIGEEDITEHTLKDLKLFDLILARETLTYNMLKGKGLTNVELCADSAFTMEKEELDLPNGWQQGNTVGLNFSPLVLSRNPKSEQSVRDLIRHIIDVTDMTIALTPHVIIDGNNDYEVLQKFYEEFKDTGRVILLPNNLNAIQYKGYIARMRFFIGARTHATIAAYSNYIPTMVLGYSVKSKGIAKDLFGEEKLVLNINEISNSDLLKTYFDEMVNEEEEIINKLNESIPQIKEMSYKAADHLQKLVK
ncbi:polysaccharide pyruvyl transferase family protein [Robertmurraya korlensis]|uniref:polysaccharide pyruvyl transferase family protein n=1 Tax=Robertmurraya korlensis TaxID=519977 RepID=UPI0008245A56|nr:polysaccharide pyruvyl transferase family protein [Robertmurraya korlensis]